MASTILPKGPELSLLGLVIAEGGWMSHDDEQLAPYCDDKSTLTKPDVFNRCHDMGWLDTKRDDRIDHSTVGITRKGREDFEAAGGYR